MTLSAHLRQSFGFCGEVNIVMKTVDHHLSIAQISEAVNPAAATVEVAPIQE